MIPAKPTGKLTAGQTAVPYAWRGDTPQMRRLRRLLDERWEYDQKSAGQRRRYNQETP